MTISFPERFNMADYFLYHNLEEGRESKICLYYEDQQFTYKQTAESANRVGNALHRCGNDGRSVCDGSQSHTRTLYAACLRGKLLLRD